MIDLHTVTPLVLSLGDALRAKGWRLAAAESCTGGLIAATCTSVAGSSDWFERGVDAQLLALGRVAVGHKAALEPVA